MKVRREGGEEKQEEWREVESSGVNEEVRKGGKK